MRQCFERQINHLIYFDLGKTKDVHASNNSIIRIIFDLLRSATGIVELALVPNRPPTGRERVADETVHWDSAPTGEICWTGYGIIYI